jgi:hypothetical protein
VWWLCALPCHGTAASNLLETRGLSLLAVLLCWLMILVDCPFVLYSLQAFTAAGVKLDAPAEKIATVLKYHVVPGYKTIPAGEADHIDMFSHSRSCCINQGAAGQRWTQAVL